MHVDDPPIEASNELGRQELHVPRKHHQVHGSWREPRGDRGVSGFPVGVGGTFEDAGLDPRLAGSIQCFRAGLVRGYGDDRDLVPPVYAVDIACRLVPTPEARTPIPAHRPLD